MSAPSFDNDNEGRGPFNGRTCLICLAVAWTLLLGAVLLVWP